MSNLKTNQSGTEEQKLFKDTNVSLKSGLLTRDPETVSEGQYIRLSIASNKQYKDGNGQIKTMTNFFNALVSKNIEKAYNTAKNFKKGDWVYLKGEDNSQSFDTAEGYKKLANTIFAYHVVLKKEGKLSEIGSKQESVLATEEKPQIVKG